MESDVARTVADAYALGHILRILPAGGTSSPKWVVEAPLGRFFIRMRSPQFRSDEFTRFDHACLASMWAAGLPVPQVLSRPDGTTWIDLPSGRCEVMSWLSGDAFEPGCPQQIAAVGRLLARLHELPDRPAGKERFLREDHPDALAEYPLKLERLARSPEERELAAFVSRQLDLLREELQTRLCPKLPTALVHGDLHPGNVRFGPGGEVAAVYDFDYLSVQPRVRDLVDALIFFASRRAAGLDCNDIRSLTQPFQLQRDQCALLLGAYRPRMPLVDDEWQAIPWFIRSRWVQMRLRGSRKVPPGEVTAFVMAGLHQPLDWLDRQADQFFAALRRETQTPPRDR